MSKFKDLCTQINRDAYIEPRMAPIASVLMTKFKDAIRYGSTTSDAPYVLGYTDVVEFMRNVQELQTLVNESLNADRQIDINRFTGKIQTITNSNPVSSVMVLRPADLFTKVAADNIPARSCGFDTSCGNPKLLPLVIASSKKICTDADYLMRYDHNPTSEFSFYFSPLGNDPTHCLFTHPRQMLAEDYNLLPDEEKLHLRQAYVEPNWTRVIRLNPKMANYMIEV